MGEADRAKYRGKRKCPECGLPVAACNEIAELKMDVRKLRAERDEHRDLGLTYHRQAVGLKEDNDRLRATLEKIARLDLGSINDGSNAIAIARKARAGV
jgi:hypothetical protein